MAKPVLPPELPYLVQAYFLDFNEGCLHRVAPMFGEHGVLHSPLDGPIHGQDAIAAYLQANAQGMTCYPETVEGTMAALVVSGRVRLPAFWVQVEWTFGLDSVSIVYLRVRLLTSLKALLQLKLK